MQIPSFAVLESWPTPNYTDPATRGPENIIITLIFYPLVCLIVGIRIYTRLRISKSFGPDDWLILAALFPTTAFAIISLVAEIHFGWNRHIWDVRADTITAGLKIVLAMEVLFGVATTLTKVSMLALIYRIMAKGASRLAKVAIGAMVLVAAQGTAFCFVVIFQCRPPSEYWTLSFKPQPDCISETKHLLAAGIVNTVTDLIVVVLPIPTVWRLKLPIQQQVIVILLFGAGFLVSCAGAVRTYYLYKVTITWDKTWEAFPVWLSSSVELYLGIICASVPVTKKFFSHHVPKWIGSAMTSRSNNASLTFPSILSPTLNSSYYKSQGEASVYPLHEYMDSKNGFGEHAAAMKQSHSISISTFNVTSPERVHAPMSRGSHGIDGIYESSRASSQEDLVV
ncbi:related to L-fucose permease [Phialocephala subalpina]|uniref:Related to L-fucose permease n=1 Tax=Phialocephala subalpina TaxID=576137 RepID=A0A1L7XK88_9HELO|nr:related to L-fucose permease [Phialocephala subalpina]